MGPSDRGLDAQLPGGIREETDRVLLDAATAGASLDDLATIAAWSIEAWRERSPTPTAQTLATDTSSSGPRSAAPG
ncbi:MAG: hypothetical protein ACRDNO_26040 [Trebonia sp.]